MSPYQHGEVFVTDDGAETDLDLGHYERFTGGRPPSATASPGAIYQDIIASERRGDYPRRRITVKVVPDVTQRHRGLHPRRQRRLSISSSAEIGGTVGDIEGPPCLRSDPPVHAAKCRAVTPSISTCACHSFRSGGANSSHADPAFGQGIALDRHPARHPVVPHRSREFPQMSASSSACSVTYAKAPSSRRATSTTAVVYRRNITPLALTRGVLAALALRTTLPPDLAVWRQRSTSAS